jgi:hypothetical protein
MIDFEDPIFISLSMATICFILSLLVLTFTKPNMVVKVNNNQKKNIDWFKMILICCIIYLGVGIITFLVLIQNRKVEFITEKEKDYKPEINREVVISRSF